MRASLVAEGLGLRSVTIVGRGFGPMGRAISKALGGREIPLAEYPGVILVDSEAEFSGKVSTTLTEEVVKGLCGPDEGQAKTEAGETLYAPRKIVFEGTLDDVQEHFYKHLWSDGLPIIPPTERRVEQFLRFTDRAAEEVIGVLKPEEREATVWSVAVNGVMAGCRPEYMPVLLAAVEAIADPEFRIEDAGSTPGWEPLVIVSGPIAKQLDFNSGTGVMRVGRRANTSIGRFLRLYMRNIAGLRIPPGTTDKGTIAFTFNVALAENEEVVGEIGWPTFGVDRGFRPGENVVTVQSVVAVSPPIYLGGEDDANMLQTLADAWGKGDLACWVHTGYTMGRWHPLLVMSPCIARRLASSGWTKTDIRKYLSDHSKTPIESHENYARQCARELDLVASGLECGLLRSAPDDGMVSTIPRAEWLGIVVAGDPDRNQVRGYMQNHSQGPPVSKAIVLPSGWQPPAEGG